MGATESTQLYVLEAVTLPYKAEHLEFDNIFDLNEAWCRYRDLPNLMLVDYIKDGRLVLRWKPEYVKSRAGLDVMRDQTTIEDGGAGDSDI